MARPAQITSGDVSLRLQTSGALTALELAEALRVDRSTISRGLTRLGDAVVTLGAARRARYALRRSVRTAGDRWPIYRVDANGRAREWARLHALHGGWWIEWPGELPAWAEHAFDREGFGDGFPFFLGDLRPQGFLGRAVARAVADTLRLPADPRQWGDDHTLHFLQAQGSDLPGDLVVGDGALRRVLAGQLETMENGRAPGSDTFIDEADSRTCYPDLAMRAMAGEWPGSSAGGEQPKFLTALRSSDGALRRVIVKFSPPLETEVGRRWADLLAAEGHARVILGEQNLTVRGHRVLDAGGRRFLEVTRHDRAGAHGRRGVVSLEALHAALGSATENNWVAAVDSLVAAGLIDAGTRRDVLRLHSFGELIGNSDMHFGNLSFWLEDTLPFRLAPAYDMLPMTWAPLRFGEIVEPANRAFAPRPPLPGILAEWHEAARWAGEFWRRVVADESISAEFAERAHAASEQVERMRGTFI
jgi:hypothetical protein